ncbi:heat shock transcription factor, X-linked member 4 [Orussus abietinus]|uniref:heat shock transcription factor, X-linked member 4 n=1 Tax=Orussus abietinus TaxID=222816 RepID=UPI000625DED1|nr:heat shock transcription factor, X-linked member 4 [Orussus abietinus]
MCSDYVLLSMRFPQKLWKIINDCKSGAIRWSKGGNSILLDYKMFQDEYLGSTNPVFKTSNITSFIRQLNLYGFRKVTSHSRDPVCNSHNPNVHEFLHDNFRVGRVDLLTRVCRKTGRKMKRSNAIVQKSELTPEKERPRMTRLQICQIALTKALEQAAKKYRQNKCGESSGGSSMENIKRYNDSDLYVSNQYGMSNSKEMMDWPESPSFIVSANNENINGHCPLTSVPVDYFVMYPVHTSC